MYSDRIVDIDVNRVSTWKKSVHAVVRTRVNRVVEYVQVHSVVYSRKLIGSFVTG